MIKNEYYELTWKIHGRILFLNWLPSSAKMSENDITDHIDVINKLIEINLCRILFIDATDFLAKPDKSFLKDLQYIKGTDNLKWIIFTSPDKNMKKLLQKAKSEGITVNEHSSRKELLQVFRESMGITDEN